MAGLVCGLVLGCIIGYFSARSNGPAAPSSAAPWSPAPPAPRVTIGQRVVAYMVGHEPTSHDYLTGQAALIESFTYQGKDGMVLAVANDSAIAKSLE